ncbi:hypothetical protein [Haloferax profundi]|uniref:Uncharacterized protein n=1 Tax=Haloferax profundi TaxID=1544718 RepID=A0A0W1S2N8_9EURY|nr:hypothetical protein [Haloferax profundi]KTG20132.1 hypothetical protein AUR66_17800 [Haloferax profundi]
MSLLDRVPGMVSGAPRRNVLVLLLYLLFLFFSVSLFLLERTAAIVALAARPLRWWTVRR